MTSPDALFESTYAVLRRVAAQRIRSGQTLEPTELVHEAFLRLDGHSFDGATHFQAVAAVAMRRILIDRARRRSADKRGGDLRPVTLAGLGIEAPDERLLDIDRALSRLEAADGRRARIVELRVFGGLELAEIAEHLTVSLSTVKRDWRAARAWLMSELT